MDLEIAEPAPDTSLSRRSLVTRAGAAGLAGLAAALVIDRNALASVEGTDDPQGVPTESDMVFLAEVMRIELAASDLYLSALPDTSDDLAAAVGLMADNHRAYAQAIAGATGLAAGTADEELVAEYEPAFLGSQTELLTSAHTLEQTLVATHTELIDQLESVHALTLVASIAVIEARHATVIAHALGVDDLDVLFGNEQSALELPGEDA